MDTHLSVFGQTFEFHDLAIIGLLIVLEGVLSIDNALVLGLLARKLPKSLQGKALTYGLIGAFIFRVIAIGTAAYLLRWSIVKLIGGAYLVYVALKHFLFEEEKPIDDKIAEAERVNSDAEPPPEARKARVSSAVFWQTVAVIELTDIAFAVDSIVAAIGVVGPSPQKVEPHPKLWVVVAGGMLGVLLMRFAAVLFIRLLERFPRFETAAYLLVALIGGKLVVDYFVNSQENPHRVDFHDWRHPAFWIFWVGMLLCFCVGFLPRKEKHVDPA